LQFHRNIAQFFVTPTCCLDILPTGIEQVSEMSTEALDSMEVDQEAQDDSPTTTRPASAAAAKGKGKERNAGPAVDVTPAGKKRFEVKKVRAQITVDCSGTLFCLLSVDGLCELVCLE
jgi:hypothetical protein